MTISGKVRSNSCPDGDILEHELGNSLTGHNVRFQSIPDTRWEREAIAAVVHHCVVGVGDDCTVAWLLRPVGRGIAGIGRAATVREIGRAAFVDQILGLDRVKEKVDVCRASGT
jgi:hypothetical protein